MCIAPDKVSKAVREEDVAQAILSILFNRAIVQNAQVMQGFQDLTLGQEVTLSPLLAGEHVGQDGLLRRQNSLIDGALVVCESP